MAADDPHPQTPKDPGSILVVLPTWVGDFVMATPTLRAIRKRFADAHITFLIEPNLVDLARGGDWMDEWVEWPQRRTGSLADGAHPQVFHGGHGRGWSMQETASGRAKPARSLLQREFRKFVRELRRRRFDWAVLLPNSFRAAWVACLSGATRRIGYDRDLRGVLLTDRLPVRNRWGRSLIARTDLTESLGVSRGKAPGRSARSKGGGVGRKRKDRQREERPFEDRLSVRIGANLPVKRTRFVPMPLVEYYADLAESIGCVRPGDRLELFTTEEDDAAVEERLAALGIAAHRPLVLLSPGARYGSAKCWSLERFASLSDRLIEQRDAVVVITCGPGEEAIARQIAAAMRSGRIGRAYVLDDPGVTLGELKALVRRCDLLICNDAGPRHFAKAFGVPVVTVFGPTHPDWTATSHEAERIVRVDVDCGPCQQRACPLGHLECMTRVTAEMVYESCVALLEGNAASTAAERVDV